MIKLLREYIRRSIILEISSGKRGNDYEAILVNELQRNNKIVVGPPAGNNTSISDIDVNVDGIDVAIEVKLSSKDLLGKVRKNHFEFLKWDGKKFNGSAVEGSLYNTINAMLIAMNNSPLVINKMKEIEPFIIPFKKLPWDLMSSFGRDDGTQEEKNLYAIMRNEPTRFQIPKGHLPVPTKQITKGGKVQITSKDIRKIISSKAGSNGSRTYYIIVGDNAVNPTGQIYSLGNGDPLGINAPLFDPGPVDIEIRFQGAGGDQDGRRFSFGFDTRGGGDLGKGVRFGDKCPLPDLLLKSCSQFGEEHDEAEREEERPEAFYEEEE